MISKIAERKAYAERRIKEVSLDLTGLNVFTEWADGEHSYVPMIISLAGAKEIYCYSKALGSEEVKRIQSINQYLPSFSIYPRLTIGETYIEQCDIVMNMGKVRPINKEMIDMMKPTAVIPMMMMPSERRVEDVDFDACEKRGVLPVFLDEKAYGILDSIGLKVLKLLFEAGLSGWHEKYLLISSGEIGFRILRLLKLYSEVILPYDNMIIKDRNYDAIIFADYYNKYKIFNYDLPDNVRIINIAGEFDYEGYKNKGLRIYPDIKPRPGHSTVGGEYLSFKILFDIIILSLKAAEVAVRARLAGKSIAETVAIVLEESPGIF
jgi:hypothetical protein